MTDILKSTHKDTSLHHFVTTSDGEPRPTVLIFHAWAGRSDFEMEKAKKLDEMGYTAIAVDLYGEGKVGASPQENEALMMPFMKDRAMLRDRILSVLSAVQDLKSVNKDRIAAIGFCFGGLCALDLARSGADVCGVVSFHGLFKPLEGLKTENMKAKVLALHGNGDPMVSTEEVIDLQKELTDAGADWQIHSYGNTVHAFTNPKANDASSGTVYDAKADRRSWNAMCDFLKESLE